MLIKNYIGGDRRLVNGSRGVVVRFEQGGGGGGGGAGEALPVVFFRATKSEVLVKRESFTYDCNGETIASRFQIPLLLGWVSSSFCCVRTRCLFAQLTALSAAMFALSAAVLVRPLPSTKLRA
jgi:hypothetical protein